MDLIVWSTKIFYFLVGIILWGDDSYFDCHYKRHFAAIALVLSWSELITLVARHPKLAKYNIYVTMFYKVLEKYVSHSSGLLQHWCHQWYLETRWSYTQKIYIKMGQHQTGDQMPVSKKGQIIAKKSQATIFGKFTGPRAPWLKGKSPRMTRQNFWSRKKANLLMKRAKNRQKS